MTESLTWSVATSADRTTIAMNGAFTEDADFEPLQRQLEGHAEVWIDLAGIRRVNSGGIREWMKFVRAVPAGVTLRLRACSPVIVTQLNTFQNFAGSGAIHSVQLPYLCRDCGAEERREVELAPGTRPAIEPVACSGCGSQMDFDDVPEVYFRFVR